MIEAARHFLGLSVDIPLISGLDLDLLDHLRIVRDRFRADAKRHQPSMIDARTAQQVIERIFTLNRLPQQTLDARLINLGRVRPGRAQARQLARDGLLLDAKGSPADISDQPKPPPLLGQTQVGVILAQRQPVFGTAGKHTVRFGNAARNEIIDEHAEIRLITTRRPAVFSLRPQGRIRPRQQALRRCLLVARRAVDLAGKKQVVDGSGFQRGLQAGWVEIIVLDGITGAQDMAVLQPFHRAHQRQLYVERQAR